MEEWATPADAVALSQAPADAPSAAPATDGTGTGAAPRPTPGDARPEGRGGAFLDSVRSLPLFTFLSGKNGFYVLGAAIAFLIGLVVFRLLGEMPTKEARILARALDGAARDEREIPASESAAPLAPPVLRAEGLVAPGTSAVSPPRPVTPPRSAVGGSGAEAVAAPRARPTPPAIRKARAKNTGLQGRDESLGLREHPPLPHYAPPVRAKGRIIVELRVRDQNSHIGTRNVHELREGASLAIGGGRSDFLVFLVPMPTAFARVHYDGVALSFEPRRPELFPELSGPLDDCLDRDIALRSPRGYPLVLRFTRWEAPVNRINKLLHSIEVPGLDWQDRSAP